MKRLILACAIVLTGCGAQLGSNVSKAVADALPRIGAALNEARSALDLASITVTVACRESSPACQEALMLRDVASEKFDELVAVYTAIQHDVDAAKAKDAAADAGK